MTTTDKTGEKLVASIRRTKNNANAANNPTATTEPVASQEAPVESTPVPAAAATSARKRKAAPAAPKTNEPQDSYRSKTRVWPD